MHTSEIPTDDSVFKMTRREAGILMAGALSTQLAAQSQTPNPGPVLNIAEWSYRFYGVEHALLARGTVVSGTQMYVEHWFPAEVRHPYPVVLIHGGYGQGSEWFSTPDGRRGWAALLLEQGYKVYVIDRPGQGRNPYYPFLHGLFDREAQTFDRVAKTVKGPQWPGPGDESDPAVVNIRHRLASQCATMRSHRTSGAPAGRCCWTTSVP